MQDDPGKTAGECMKCNVLGPLRRRLCPACYTSWLLAKPVGLAASCVGCGERRLLVLRYYEIHREFVVVCYNCSVRAAALHPQPRTAQALQWRLQRERRTWDRRAPGATSPDGSERRRRDRRVGARDLFDATDLAQEVPDGAEAESSASGAAPEATQDPVRAAWPKDPVAGLPKDDLTRIHHRL